MWFCFVLFSQRNYVSILSIVPLKINIQKSKIYKCGSYEGLKMEHCSLYLDEGRSEREEKKPNIPCSLNSINSGVKGAVHRYYKDPLF